jgi:hypothetical protein
VDDQTHTQNQGMKPTVLIRTALLFAPLAALRAAG